MDLLTVGSAVGLASVAGVFWFLRRRGGHRSMTFRERAEMRGLSRSTVDLLERIAREAHPERPDEILHSRLAFEQSVQQHVLGERDLDHAGFEAMLELAIAKERLGLRSVAERPLPFQRCTIRWRHRSELDPAIVIASGNHIRVVLPKPSEGRIAQQEDRCFLRYNTPRQMAEVPMVVKESEAFDEGCLLVLTRIAHDDPIGRREPRCPVFVDAWVSFPTEEERGEFGTVFNLTESGLLFETERHYPENARLLVRLNLGTHGVFGVAGQVRWTCPNVDDRWRHGFSFEGPSVNDLAPLRAYLDEVRPRTSRVPVSTPVS